MSHNWDLLADALAEFGQDGTDVLRQGAEAMDVAIRCYLLGECISEALDELEDELEPEEESDEEGKEDDEDDEWRKARLTMAQTMAHWS